MQNVPAAVYAIHWGHAGVYHSISWDLTLVWWDLDPHSIWGYFWWDLMGSTLDLVLFGGIWWDPQSI